MLATDREARYTGAAEEWIDGRPRVDLRSFKNFWEKEG